MSTPYSLINAVKFLNIAQEKKKEEVGISILTSSTTYLIWLTVADKRQITRCVTPDF